MTKGNIPINKSLAKEVENGKVVQVLPDIPINRVTLPLFTTIPSTRCSVCGSPLNPNKNYDRFIISSYGILICPVTYRICSKCGKHHTDTIVGVTGSANYSDEYKEKQNAVRYNGRCSLWNTRIVGEIFTEGLTDISGRAPCPTTLWAYEQKKGKNREWKMLRYKVIYVVATEDKVVLDFTITNINPSYLELIPLLDRIKDRILEEKILKIVSDEEYAIIGAVSTVFPDVIHSFCVLHQLKNLTKKYLDEFGSIENIPSNDLELYELTRELILAETSIHSSISYQGILKLASSAELSRASQKAITYAKEIYQKNRLLLEKGFTPETNNVMEQLFSVIDNFVDQARSFKATFSTVNFFYNLFVSMNRRCFNTGNWKGFSPINRAKMKYG
jgi:RNase P subunit RPR2